MIDLNKFCKQDGDPRLGPPFTQNGKTWACNGWLAIGVPALRDVPVNSMAPDMTKAHPATDPDTWYGVPVVDVQPCKVCKGQVKSFTCPECNGKGIVTLQNDFSIYEPECNTCDGEGDVGECTHCSGTGYDSDNQTDIGPATFNDRALLLIMNLPNVQIGPTGKLTPAMIKFDGGEGYLAPANKI